MYPQSLLQPIPFQDMPGGLYLIKRPSSYPMIEHYGVLIVGRALRSFGYDSKDPIILHLVDRGVKADWAVFTGAWDIVGQVPRESEALAVNRFSQALQNSDYNLFTNNCEQFARFVTEGQKYSSQVAAAVVIGLTGLAVWAAGRA